MLSMLPLVTWCTSDTSVSLKKNLQCSSLTPMYWCFISDIAKLTASPFVLDIQLRGSSGCCCDNPHKESSHELILGQSTSYLAWFTSCISKDLILRIKITISWREVENGSTLRQHSVWRLEQSKKEKREIFPQDQKTIWNKRQPSSTHSWDLQNYLVALLWALSLDPQNKVVVHASLYERISQNIAW